MSAEIPANGIDPELDALDDPDLRQHDSEITDEDQPGNPADPRGLATDTLDGDDESETFEPDHHLSNATGLLMDDTAVDPIEQRLAQEEPDVGDIGAASTGPDHVAEADTFDANVVDKQVGHG
ncbi:hypothetical protein CLV92_10514 [Kineococcus xinjiangensis]|uniref:DUF5709 domain-containing protein n=1 Tax=Kineococcus xinjiangensis TaxID=512762 RepID=A0A2S6IP63_9ACTN|nr:hypothetical protein [Kineococcus xinjiangensis]PPK95920.1 hypothetical protein CLV92_10514 [Kineococcus xinjiangensis]